jgi:5-methylcytosine-specific restriction protein A
MAPLASPKPTVKPAQRGLFTFRFPVKTMARLKTLAARVGTLPPRLAVQQEGWRNTGMTSGDRGYTYQWQQARARHLRLHPLCVLCQAEGIVASALVVDHRIPHRGDMVKFWDQDNWQSLCAHHHSSTKQRDESAVVE